MGANPILKSALKGTVTLARFTMILTVKVHLIGGVDSKADLFIEVIQLISFLSVFSMVFQS